MPQEYRWESSGAAEECSSAAALVFYLPGACTHTDTERKHRKARVRNIFEKNTIFNEHPVDDLDDLDSTNTVGMTSIISLILFEGAHRFEETWFTRRIYPIKSYKTAQVQYTLQNS